jgi:hypothetical protein
MRSINTDYIVFDTSWTNEYDKYLKRFDHQKIDVKNSFALEQSVQPIMEISHNMMFNTIFHTAKTKRRVINIYKRPI